MQNSGTRMSVRAASAGLGLLFLLSGCDYLLSAEAGLANHGRIDVSGTSTVPLLLITSTDFFATRDPQTNQWDATLASADTLEITALPASESLSLRGHDRFLVRLVNPDTAVTVTVRLEVVLDGTRVYAQNATLRDASIEYLTYFDPN